MPQPLNVLFITADQWRGDCLSALNHPCLKTPHLDALAADGLLFRQHYSQATPCGPGRTSLYTGLYLKNHRAVTNGTPCSSHFTNVALEARRGGYDPVLFGYTDTAPDPRDHPAGDPALTTYEGLLPGMRPVLQLMEPQESWVKYLKSQGYDVPGVGYDLFQSNDEERTNTSRGPTQHPAFYRKEHSLTAYLASEAIGYLEGRTTVEPWFLHLSFFCPHPPWAAPAPYNERYDASDMPTPHRAATPNSEGRQHPWLNYFLQHQNNTELWIDLPPGAHNSFSDSDVQRIRSTYFGLMSEVDDQIGRLIGYLKDKGLYESTLIVFTSDHGEQLGDHWLFGKRSYFDGSFHIPLILRDPRAAADVDRGRVVSHFTENVDVMPTMLDLLGLPMPAQCDGASLRPFCRGDTPDNWRQEAHFEFDFRDVVKGTFETALNLTSDQCNLAVIRGERYKYVHFPTLPALFFDLETDPREFNNLAEDPAYGAQVLAYAQKMLSWRMNHESRGFTHQKLTPDGLVTGKVVRNNGPVAGAN